MSEEKNLCIRSPVGEVTKTLRQRHRALSEALERVTDELSTVRDSLERSGVSRRSDAYQAVMSLIGTTEDGLKREIKKFGDDVSNLEEESAKLPQKIARLKNQRAEAYQAVRDMAEDAIAHNRERGGGDELWERKREVTDKDIAEYATDYFSETIVTPLTLSRRLQVCHIALGEPGGGEVVPTPAT